MSDDSAHKSKWVIAEVVFGIPFLLSLALHFIIPVFITQGILRLALIPAGTALVFLGMRFVVLARREFARYGQPTDPGNPTSQVVKSGPFAVSRNPLYLACILIFLGIGLALNILWALIALVISAIICHYVLILPEERYLVAKFGDAYRDYRASVYRWLGRKR